MKVYYMRDNHTFQPLPLNLDVAEAILRREFEQGYTGGTIFSRAEGLEEPLHANGRERQEPFFAKAREWLRRAIDLDETR